MQPIQALRSEMLRSAQGNELDVMQIETPRQRAARDDGCPLLWSLRLDNDVAEAMAARVPVDVGDLREAQ